MSAPERAPRRLDLPAGLGLAGVLLVVVALMATLGTKRSTLLKDTLGAMSVGSPDAVLLPVPLLLLAAGLALLGASWWARRARREDA